MANDYDSFAEAYAVETESNLLNGYFARPAVLDLAEDVAGRRFLMKRSTMPSRAWSAGRPC